MPELAPVTIATLLFKRFMVSSPGFEVRRPLPPLSLNGRWHFPFVRISLQIGELEFGKAER
jgi:hypothetical protein